MAKPASKPDTKPAPAEKVTAEVSDGPFRWPARGRIIAGFGSAAGNEGIKLSLPEGAPVRAVQSGTVTYVGDDIKPFGNLVVNRHDNGYVSAYAHNSEMDDKRGDSVLRVQIIAKAGSTGDVTAPQLHFELRKDGKPIDPRPMLGG
jgi:murein DD-endopeptidase MepM/ murein hydrolase activator NlpD